MVDRILGYVQFNLSNIKHINIYTKQYLVNCLVQIEKRDDKVKI